MNRQLFILFLIIAVLAGCQTKPSFKKLGGTRLVYQIDRDGFKREPVDKKKLVATFQQRLDPYGDKGIIVQMLDSDSVEILIPGMALRASSWSSGESCPSSGRPRSKTKLPPSTLYTYRSPRSKSRRRSVRHCELEPQPTELSFVFRYFRKWAQ